MVIWDRKTLSPQLTIESEVLVPYMACQEAWMDQELFDRWFSNHFLRYAPSVRPLLLLLDGHSSYCPDTIRLAAQHQVISHICFATPHYTSNDLTATWQGVLWATKAAWRKVWHQYLTKNLWQCDDQIYVVLMLSGHQEAWMQSMTGCHPFSNRFSNNVISSSVNLVARLSIGSHST